MKYNYRYRWRQTDDKRGVIAEAAAQCYLHEYDKEQALNSQKVCEAQADFGKGIGVARSEARRAKVGRQNQ